MKKYLSLSVLSLLVALSACKGDKKKQDGAADGTVASKTIAVEHSLGTTEVKQHPENVVVLDYGSLETLDVLGVPVAGIPKSSFLPSHLAKYRDDASIADVGTLVEVDFEQINALAPELIITSARLQKDYPELSRIAPTVFVELDPKEYMSSFEKNVHTLAGIFGKEKEADEALDAIRKKVEAVRARTAGMEEKGLVVLSNNGRVSAYGSGSRFGMIHDVLGVPVASSDLQTSPESHHGRKISYEFIQEINPGYIYVIDRGAVVTKKPLEKEAFENALVQKTDAYKNGKIIYLNPEVWYLSGGGIISVNRMIDEISETL
ncbi:siderophore ABC transporter substrate-binding protein [Sinomicrobium soli]|uniref:siderophore ABC transporter substrate-binding protein n=1 Tax=Sinomicrobium sp. N-1-3-6 TaxID=2219864 RepID=UPI000DCCDE61|nr:siderophore ABC transporter substrate-binding protein [Sinomicrobium sp. N-1-3-6]RAV27558.1 ABC transporter [Sinomicrobium sp. N-1-3-6]